MHLAGQPLRCDSVSLTAKATRQTWQALCLLRQSDKYILERGTEVKRPTLNKDIRNLKTFINWCRENRYLNRNLKLKELKEEEKPVRSRNEAEIKTLLKATEQYTAMKIRVLLALATGLHPGDIDSLKISDIQL